MAEELVPECALTDRNLVDISNSIGYGWESLAVYLKIPQAHIEHIKADHRQSMQQQIYNMLLKWRNAEGCNATLTALLNKIINVPGITVGWDALQDIFGPVVDNVLQTRRDHCQLTRTLVSLDINKIDYIPAPITSVPQLPLTMLQTRRDHIQQACPLRTMDITEIGHIPAPITSVPQMPLTGESAEILTMLQHDLISYYQQLFCSLQISPLIEEDGHASSFFDLYVKPVLTIPNRPGQVKTIHDIFVKDSKPCKKVYISSPAGCGKTSFAKYLALIWCQAHLPVKTNDNWCIAEDIDEMRTFKLLFFVLLRDEHEQECDVDTMIQNHLLPKLANSVTYTEKGLKFLQKLLSCVKCIIILDGLDEWSHPHGNGCKLHDKKTPYIRARPLCTTLTTSRPWKLDVVSLKPEEIDQKLELNGLENDLLQSLIRNVVKKLNELHGKEMNAYDFELELKDKKLTDLCKIPVVVMQLLTVWFDNDPLGKSQCEIYSNVIEFLLKRYCKKSEIVSVMEDMETDDSSRYRQTPKCLQNQMSCKAHMKLLSKLAILAFEMLFTGNREVSLMFDVIVTKKYLTDQEIEMSLAVGILTQEKVPGKISIRQSHISFIHKTFQEYFAALCVALSPGMMTNVEEKIRHFCCSIEKILEMSQMFMYLSGLCPEVMVNFDEHLRQTVSKDERTMSYRASSELGPSSSEGRIMRLVQDAMVEWLGDVG